MNSAAPGAAHGSGTASLGRTTMASHGPQPTHPTGAGFGPGARAEAAPRRACQTQVRPARRARPPHYLPSLDATHARTPRPESSPRLQWTPRRPRPRPRDTSSSERSPATSVSATVHCASLAKREPYHAAAPRPRGRLLRTTARAQCGSDAEAGHPGNRVPVHLTWNLGSSPARPLPPSRGNRQWTCGVGASDGTPGGESAADAARRGACLLQRVVP